MNTRSILGELIGEEGVEELLAKTTAVAVETGLIEPGANGAAGCVKGGCSDALLSV